MYTTTIINNNNLDPSIFNISIISIMKEQRVVCGGDSDSDVNVSYGC
jgi:hypothetical protein